MIAHFRNQAAIVYGAVIRIETIDDGLTKVWMSDPVVYQFEEWNTSSGESWMPRSSQITMEDPV
jgi:hypothetical protein